MNGEGVRPDGEEVGTCGQDAKIATVGQWRGYACLEEVGMCVQTAKIGTAGQRRGYVCEE